MHSLGQLRTFLPNLSCCVDDLLIEHLITVGEVRHFGAENDRILIHLDTDFALFGHKLNDSLAILRLLEDFV